MSVQTLTDFPPQLEQYVVRSGEVGFMAWAVTQFPFKPAQGMRGEGSGYVRVNMSHPLRTVEDTEEANELLTRAQLPHGRVTFVQSPWVGFDTCHAGDWWETQRGYILRSARHTTPWTLDKLVDETIRWATVLDGMNGH